jgi:hypothetical protein
MCMLDKVYLYVQFAVIFIEFLHVEFNRPNLHLFYLLDCII